MRVQSGMLARTLDRLSWPLAVTVALWSLTLLWDASALDVRVMQAIGTAQGFAWRHHPWLQQYLHDDVRWLAWGVYALLWVGCIKPAGPWAQWSRSERWLMLWGITLALLSVTLLKRQSLTSCPWKLSDFGGTAHYVSHWTWGVRDGGSGHCFPGGHASTAMAFLALALPGLHHPERRQQQRALKLLAAIAGLGLLLGGVQTLRGAHYPSHTLWTATLCWSSAWLSWQLWHQGQRVWPRVAPRLQPQRPASPLPDNIG